MRLLHVITDLKLGGESQHLLASIQALDDFDHAVACMSVNLDYETAPHDVSSEVEDAGVSFVDLGVQRGRPKTFAAAAYRLARFMRDHRPDLVHSSLVHANLLSLATAPAGVPVIAGLVSVAPWTAAWQAGIHRVLSRRADVVLVNSPSVASALIAGGERPERVRCLPYGVDAQRFAPSGPRADLGPGTTVVGIGRLIAVKGFADLIAASAAMSAKPRIVLVGEGPLAHDLESQAVRLGVDLVLTGGVADVAPYLRRADAVAIPSRWEGVPNVLLEALATGRPIVASEVGGIPDVVEHGEHAVLVPPGDPAFLASGLDRALGAEGSDMARRGRDLVLERYEWNRYIEERRTLYEEVVRMRKRRRAAGAAAAERRNRAGLVLVVPKAGSEVSEHFAHTFRLAEHLQLHTRTAVVVERLTGELPPMSSAVGVYVQRHADAGALRRAWELIRLGVRLRQKGFTSFFVRTSQTAALPLILVRRLLGGRVMYWNCGKAPKNKLWRLDLRTLVKSELPFRAAFRWADTFVTGTPSLAEHYVEIHGVPRNRVAVLPNEIDLERFRPADPQKRREARSALEVSDDEQIVLAVHRFSPVRRTLLYVPAAVQAVVERHADARFVFAGGGPEEAEVREAVAQAGLENRVALLGPVPHDRVWSLYAAADLFMMPSYTEGFPRVLLEAMAMSLPIASTDVGGVREILPGAYHGRLADRDEPLELARAVDELLSDPAKAHELATEGRRWVRRFDAPLVAKQLAALANC